MEQVEALIGFDTGQLTNLSEKVKEKGGFTGQLEGVITQIKRARPEKVTLGGEMLQTCVRIAVEKLLEWEENGEKPIKELVVDLRNCRHHGVNDGGFNPNPAQLKLRRLSLTGRLEKKYKDDPRLKIIPGTPQSSQG